jgi:thiol-disulfide isomerase/thioredoxin
MAKAFKRSTFRRSQIRNSGLMLIGIGLLLLGVVTGIMLIGADKAPNSNLASGDDLLSNGSVIPVEVNFKAPNLKLKDLQGNDVSISDHLGKVVLINNWATWCPPCKAEMPALEAFYNKHRGEGFILIAIDAGDTSTDVEEFVNEYGLSFPVWMDPDSQALEAFKNYGLPNSYVIDKDGVVQLAWTGAISDLMLEKYVTPLLQE